MARRCVYSGHMRVGLSAVVLWVLAELRQKSAAGTILFLERISD